jgi:putative endonuclease
MHTVYIIYSPSTDKYFIGLSKDIKITLWQHNARTVSATADGKPWEVKFSQSFETRREAQSLEMKLKNRDRAFWEDLINSQQPATI